MVGSALAALLSMGGIGCQAPGEATPADTSTSAAGTSAVLTGGTCAAHSQCAPNLLCVSNTCIPNRGLSVRPRCTYNAAARITLLSRDPDAPWLGDGPPPAASYAPVGSPVDTYQDTGELASFPTAGAGTYIISIEGQSGTQQTGELDYDGSPTLIEPTYDGFCFAETPAG